MTVNLPGLNVIQRGLIRYAEIKFSHDERSFEIKVSYLDYYQPFSK